MGRVLGNSTQHNFIMTLGIIIMLLNIMIKLDILLWKIGDI